MEIKRHHGVSEFRRDLPLSPASIAQRWLPILGWLPGYRREWLLSDVLAGLAVWAVMVPEGMAYAGYRRGAADHGPLHDCAAVDCLCAFGCGMPRNNGVNKTSVLAAIVIAAMLHLSRPEYLRDLCARSRLEFALAAIVIAEELALGVPHGIALGVTLSLLMLIYRTSHLQGAVLGQLPGTEAYRDVRRHPEAITFPGVLIWRIGGDLFFSW